MEEKKKYIIVLIIILITYIYYNNNESFWVTQINRPLRYCRYCGYNNYHSCNNCVNCGFCTTSKGYGECVNGDQNGPFFRKDCLYWDYRQPSYYLDHNPNYIYYPSNYFNPRRNWINRYGNKYWRNKQGKYYKKKINKKKINKKNKKNKN